MINIEQKISKRIGKAIFDYKMICPDDKILVAVSGGKDSMTLLYDLAKRRKSFPIKYEIEAVHIMTDFCECCKKNNIEEKFREFGIKYHIKYVPVLRRLKPGKKMNCFWCSSQRRLELLEVAKNTGCNKIALGHHLDDIVETFFLNVCFKSEISTMLPSLKYTNFPYTIIRPLAYIKEKEIIKFAKDKNFYNLICKCPYGNNSKRKEIKSIINELSKKNKNIREVIFKSFKNVKMDYLIN